ncbi:hypothetical protein NDU88_010318 [Pleurodeles waltl]|uniref:Secreted protein n=1 Tax=Pleurodeles waltl TaxID=8319 RepID=A0AAV7PZR3_PLEWA|nr:hypothetical protein NDU88_010318 [Pleurodeles waltl]
MSLRSSPPPLGLLLGATEESAYSLCFPCIFASSARSRRSPSGVYRYSSHSPPSLGRRLLSTRRIILLPPQTAERLAHTSALRVPGCFLRTCLGQRINGGTVCARLFNVYFPGTQAQLDLHVPDSLLSTCPYQT